MTTRQRKSGWIEWVKRVVRYRLHIPMKRCQHPPEHIARGVMVGFVWAMLPFFGIQMGLVFVTWLITRGLFKWNFSLVNGLAWTWVTNVFTIIPAYYLFYVTGQFMLGHHDDISGYGAFTDVLHTFMDWEGGAWNTIVSSIDGALTTLFIPILVGSIPWAIASGWLAYKLSLQFVINHRKRRARRRNRLANTARSAAT